MEGIQLGVRVLPRLIAPCHELGEVTLGVLEGQLVKLNFVNPHPSMIVAVPNADGTATEWTLTTASIQNLTARGINKASIKAGDSLKITALPARNGNPAGFVRRLELGDKQFNLVID